jgi:filamentous hemagglutinin
VGRDLEAAGLKLGEIIDELIIDPRKLTHYALDLESPAGRDKAILFQSVLGFTKDDHADLIQQLRTETLAAEALFQTEDEYGRRFRVDVPVEGPNGRQAIVRTGWIVPPGSRAAHLVTLFLKKR